jgi:hypothetical protein
MFRAPWTFLFLFLAANSSSVVKFRPCRAFTGGRVVAS